MSESPKSRMFEFAAMRNWAKHWATCRHVLTLLLVALFLGAWYGTASAQPPIDVPGGTIVNRITFEQPGAAGFTGAYNEYEVASILRVVAYLNDLVDVPMQTYHGGQPRTLFFRKDPPELTGTATGGPGGTITYNVEWTKTDGAESSQLGMVFWENVLTHELGHFLGMLFGGPGMTLADGSNSTSGSVTITGLGGDPWSGWFRDANGNPFVVGQTYDYDLDSLFLFVAPLASAVNGDVWAGGTDRGVAIHPEIGGSGHPYDPPGAVISYRGYQDRDFFSEVELSYLVDMGYTIQLDRFFGRSLNRIHPGTIYNDTAFYGDGTFGVGLHIVISDDQNINNTKYMNGITLDPNAVGNTVVQRANLIATGKHGAGIRIEGNNHSVTINDGVIVAGNGEHGIGVVITMQAEGGASNTLLANHGTIAATGLSGTGVWVRSDVLAFDNYGTIFAGRLDAQGNPMLDNAGRLMLNNAIFIDNNGGRGGWGQPDENGWMYWTLLAPRVGAINLHGGTHIVGNIVNTSNFAGTTQTVEISGGNATIHGTVRGFSEGVIVRNDGGLGAGLQGDYGILGTVTNVFGGLVIEGDLLMEGGSTLLVNLGEDGFSSDLIVVNGTATLGSPQGVDPNTGLLTNGIYIQLMSLFEGQYTLLTADTLNFTRVNEPWGAIGFLNEFGEDYSIAGMGGGRKAVEFTLTDTPTELQLGITITSGDVNDSLRINWTGAVNNTWINYLNAYDSDGNLVDQLENWQFGSSALFFVNGDGAVFTTRAPHYEVDEDGEFILDITGNQILIPDDPNIVVDNTNGDIVAADMRITGNLDWIFNGGSITGDATESNLVNATGMLTMAGTGKATLNNDTTFLGNGDPTYNLLGLGATITSGTLILNAEHTFGNTGSTATSTVDVLVEANGTLQIGTGGSTGNLTLASGNLENHGELVFNRSNMVVVDYNIFGTGALTQRGSGELILRGDGTAGYTYDYEGATTVEDGTLLVSNLAGTSALNVWNDGVFKGLYDTTDVTVDGMVNNSGTISDIVTLRADTAYNMGLMENIKTLDVAGVLANTGLMKNVDKIVAGEVSNYDSVFIANTRTGRIQDVDEIHTNGLRNQGYIVSGESMHVRMARAPDPGPNLVPRGTFVNDRGTLVIGTVSDTGHVNGIGTLTIDGNFQSSQGAFSIYIDESTGGHSKINVDNGSAYIDGGRLNVVLDGKPIKLNEQYTFLDVRDGELYVNPYSELVASSIEDPLLRLELAYDEHTYWISLSRAFIYSGRGETPNQRVLALYTDLVGTELFAGNPSGDLRNVLSALDNAGETARAQMSEMSTMSVVSATSKANALPAWSEQNEPIHYALDQMAGSIFGTATTASFQNTVLLHTSLANVLRRDYNTINAINAYYGRSNPIPTGNLWGMIYGHAGSSQNDGNVNGYRHGFHGIMAGVDRLNERRLRLGLFVSAGNGSLSSNLRDRTLSSEFMLGHYVRRDGQLGYLLFQAGFGHHRYETRRELTFISRSARSQHGAFLATAHGEAGLRYRNSVLNLSPFVGVQATGLVREGFTERGAGSLNLTADMENYNSFRTMFGMRFDSMPLRVRNGLASFYGNVAWMYEFESGDRHTKFSARFTDAGLFGSKTFTVHGNDPGRDWVQAGFGLNVDFNSRLRGSAGYDAYANQRQVMHSANIGFIWQN